MVLSWNKVTGILEFIVPDFCSFSISADKSLAGFYLVSYLLKGYRINRRLTYTDGTTRFILDTP